MRGQMSEDLPPDLSEQIARMGSHWGMICVIGALYLVIGFLAFTWPLGSTLGVTFALGALLCFGGVLHGAHALQLRRQAGATWRVFQSVIAFATGLLILTFPGSGRMGIAMAMGVYFFMSAIGKWSLSANMRPHRGAGWAFASGTASFFLGACILLTFPYSALWAPGIILGVDFAFLGASMIGFSQELRILHRRHEAAEARVPSSDEWHAA